MENLNVNWSQAWKKSLPILALVGPILFFIAALVRALGIGTLPGGLNWLSAPEGLLMSIGAPFFVATFIFLGQIISEQSPKTGILVTVLGVLGTAYLSFVSGFRGLAKGFVESGLDPNLIQSAFDSEAAVTWLSPLLLFHLGQLIAWIIAGVVIIRKKVAPLWVGLALILGVPFLLTAQAFYFNLEIFWPLANGLWLLGVWGLGKFEKKIEI